MGWWKKDTCHSTSHTPNKQGNTYKKLKYSCVSRPSRSSCYLLQTLYHSSSHYYTSRQSISRSLAFYFYQLCKWRWHAIHKMEIYEDHKKWTGRKSKGDTRFITRWYCVHYTVRLDLKWKGMRLNIPTFFLQTAIHPFRHSFFSRNFFVVFWNIHDTKWIEWNGMEQRKRKMRVVKHVTLQKHANSFFKAKDDVMWRDGMQGCFIICHMEYISSFLFPSSSYDHVHFFWQSGNIVIIVAVICSEMIL